MLGGMDSAGLTVIRAGGVIGGASSSCVLKNEWKLHGGAGNSGGHFRKMVPSQIMRISDARLKNVANSTGTREPSSALEEQSEKTGVLRDVVGEFRG